MLIIKAPAYKEMANISKASVRNNPPKNTMVSGNKRLEKKYICFQNKMGFCSDRSRANADVIYEIF